MADLQKLKTINKDQRKAGVFRDWDCEGALYMKGAKTIKHDYANYLLGLLDLMSPPRVPCGRALGEGKEETRTLKGIRL